MLLKGRRVRNFLIFPKFQLTLVFLNLFVMTVNFGLIFYQVADSFSKLTTMADSLRVPKYSSFYNLLDYHQNLIWNQLVIACVLIYIFSFIITVVVSHRVSGPIHNLKNYFQKIAETGEVGELKFRGRDYYGELPELVNKAIERIRSKE